MQMKKDDLAESCYSEYILQCTWKDEVLQVFKLPEKVGDTQLGDVASVYRQ